MALIPPNRLFGAAFLYIIELESRFLGLYNHLVSLAQLRYSGELPFYIQAGESAFLSAAEGVTPPESLRYS